MKSFTLAAFALAVAPLLMTIAAYGADTKDQAYLTDRNGAPVEVRSGGCMRTRYWTVAQANARCKASAEKVSLPSK